MLKSYYTRTIVMAIPTKMVYRTEFNVPRSKFIGYNIRGGWYWSEPNGQRSYRGREQNKTIGHNAEI